MYALVATIPTVVTPAIIRDKPNVSGARAAPPAKIAPSIPASSPPSIANTPASVTIDVASPANILLAIPTDSA